MAKEEVVRFRGDFVNRLKTRFFYGRLFARQITFPRIFNSINAELDAKSRNSRPGSKPYILKIETTNFCTNRCFFCLDGRRPPVDGERAWGTMDLTTFEEVLGLFADTALIALLYGYGEPLLDPTIGEKIETCSRAGVTSMISTDLLPADRKVIADVVDAGIDAIRISLHGDSRGTYEKYARTDKYEEVLDNLRFLLAYRSRREKHLLIEWLFCFHNYNVHEIESARQKARDMGVDHFRVTPLWVPPEAASEWMPPQVLEEFVKDAADLTCSIHYREIMVNWDGTLRPCCRNERTLKLDLGDFRDFEELWKGPIYKYIRNVSSGRCKPDAAMEVPCNVCEIVSGRKVPNW
ncbi:MAG: radical SAM protein [Candidatus Coatesbacteria bacterium]|nr:MAG: radical SAM protein [Candidatus Coatesbacteria bacterium]